MYTCSMKYSSRLFARVVHATQIHERHGERPGESLRFYTDKLGFVKMADIPMGEYRWLTVISPEAFPVSNWFWNLWFSSS